MNANHAENLPVGNIIHLSFRNHTPRVQADVTLADAIKHLIAAKTAAHRRPKYVDSLRLYLTAFAKGRETTLISQLTADDLEDWFAMRGEQPATRNSNIGRFSSLFEYARRRKWVPENICADVEKSFCERGVPVIMSVENCRLLMNRAREFEPDLIPYFALALFCGIRPDEIKRLNSRDISLERGFVEISAATSKTRRRRLVTINATARAWLELNSTLPIMNWRRKFRRVRSNLIRKKWVAAIPWHHDILRHTAASMMFTTHGSIVTARELGHSEQMLFTHYREMVSPQDAEAFWQILP